MKSKVSIISAGGTVLCRESKNTKPSESGREFISRFKKKFPFIEDIVDIIPADPGIEYIIDSACNNPRTSCDLTKAIYEECKKEDINGIIVLHGTDTMVQSAALTAFSIENINKPIIFTGAQKPQNDPNFDGYNNVLNSIFVVTQDLVGSYIVFANRIHKAVRTKKIDNVKLEAYSTVNEAQFGEIYNGLVSFNLRVPRRNGQNAVYSGFLNQVHTCFLYPGIDPIMLDLQLRRQRSSIILAYGSGNMPYDDESCPESEKYSLEGIIKKNIEEGKSIVIASQCLEGNVDLTKYTAGYTFLKAGAIPGYDMTYEAINAKLNWALNKTQDPKEVRRLMLKNIVGEIKIPAV